MRLGSKHFLGLTRRQGLAFHLRSACCLPGETERIVAVAG